MLFFCLSRAICLLINSMLLFFFIKRSSSVFFFLFFTHKAAFLCFLLRVSCDEIKNSWYSGDRSLLFLLINSFGAAIVFVYCTHSRGLLFSSFFFVMLWIGMYACLCVI